jgi:HEAT repeat protein
VEALGKIGDSQAVESLVAALRGADKHVQEAASQALARIGEKAVGPLVEVVTGDLGATLYNNKEEERRRAAKTLAAIASPVAVDRLIAAFSSPDHTVRGFCAMALSGYNEARVTNELIRLIGYECYYVCCAAAEALGVIGDPCAVQPLIDALEAQAGKDHDWKLPRGIIIALSKLGDARAIEPLSTFLSHKSSYEKGSEMTRSQLAWALGNIGDSTVIAVLKRTLTTDPEEKVRGEAARALGNLAERGQLGSFAGIVRTALEAAYESDTSAARYDAFDALDKLAKLGLDNVDKIKEELPIKEVLPIKEQISIKEQIFEYLSDYSESAMIEELAKMLSVLYKQSNQEYESDNKDAHEITLGLIKYIGEKLNLKGGEGLMRQVLIQAGSFGCNTRFIEREWSGIGAWRG